MNAEKKRRQMILLEEAVHKVKVEFNNKVRELNGGQGALDGEGRGPLRMRAGGPSLLLEAAATR